MKYRLWIICVDIYCPAFCSADFQNLIITNYAIGQWFVYLCRRFNHSRINCSQSISRSTRPV